MHLTAVTLQLQQQAQIIQACLQNMSEEQARWRPDAQSWSSIEVINHLYDEEREDFRPRLQIMLLTPDQAMSPIDPEGWVTKRGYQERPLAPSLNNFLVEREKSIQWLSQIENPNWEATYEFRFGPMQAGDMLAAWLAHDLLHIRQLNELKWVYTNHKMHPYTTRYAGEWS